MRLVSIVAGVLLLTGCSSITSGTVTAKSHRDAYTDYTPVCMAYDKNSLCTYTAQIPEDVPECWDVEFASNGDSNDSCVGKAVWDHLSVGDHFDTNSGS